MNRGLDFKLDGTGSALRHCALLLHSMGLDDRDWFLANLGGPRVKELQQLLGELKALGIPADPAAAQTALKQTGAAPATTAQAFPSPAREGSGTDRLHDASAAELAQVLEHEPAGLIAQALAMCASPQRKAILAQLNAPKRRRVQELLADAGPGAAAPRSSQALLEQLAVQLGRMPRRTRPARRPWLRLAALRKTRWPGLRSIFS
jgi:hypothetical protein